MLTLPEVIAYSSNLGAAHMAQAMGADRQRSWLQADGDVHAGRASSCRRQGQPIVQPAANWKEIVDDDGRVRARDRGVTAACRARDGGDRQWRDGVAADHSWRRMPDMSTQSAVTRVGAGNQVMQHSTSDTMRKLMRLVVTDGYGKPADVPGYFVGGKTGTAEKNSGHGYKKHSNISAFMSVFPMNAPKYAVYFMLDEPKGNASTGGYSTAGAVSAPGAGRVIGRIGPMLGLMPEPPAAQAAAIAGDAGDAAERGAARDAGVSMHAYTKPAVQAGSAGWDADGEDAGGCSAAGPRQREASYVVPARG